METRRTTTVDGVHPTAVTSPVRSFLASAVLCIAKSSHLVFLASQILCIAFRSSSASGDRKSRCIPFTSGGDYGSERRRSQDVFSNTSLSRSHKEKGLEEFLPAPREMSFMPTASREKRVAPFHRFANARAKSWEFLRDRRRTPIRAQDCRKMQFPPEGNEYPCAARWCEMLCRPDWPSTSEFPSWLHGPPPLRHMLYDTRAPHPLSTGPSDYSEIFGISNP